MLPGTGFFKLSGVRNSVRQTFILTFRDRWKMKNNEHKIASKTEEITAKYEGTSVPNYNFPVPPNFVPSQAQTGASVFASNYLFSRTICPPSIHKRDYTTTSHRDRILSSACHVEKTVKPNPIYISSEDSDIEEINAPSKKTESVYGLSIDGRQWERCSSSSAAYKASDCVNFSVMSYNILSQQLLFGNQYLYQTCSTSNLDEKTRISRIISELDYAKADIMCLQELEARLFFNELKTKFEAQGYQCIYKKRTGQKPDGCAIFFNSKKFKVLKSREVEYYAPNVDLLDRDNVAIVTLLELRSEADNQICQSKRSRRSETPARLVLANTHLLFNQRRGDIKLAQLQYLFAEIDRMAFFGVDSCTSSNRLSVYYPIIFCGDLNLEPYSPLYDFIAEGVLRYEGLPRAMLSGQTSPSSLALVGNGPVMSRSLLPDSFGLADNSEFADSCTAKNSVTSCVNSFSGSPITANIHKDITRKIDSSDTTYARQYYSGVASHPFLLQPVYLYDKVKGDFTSLTRGSPHIVDHMFYSVIRSDQSRSSLQEGRLQLLRRLCVPTAEVIRNGSIPRPRPSLPVAAAPSDHIPLFAEFRYELPGAGIQEINVPS